MKCFQIVAFCTAVSMPAIGAAGALPELIAVHRDGGRIYAIDVSGASLFTADGGQLRRIASVTQGGAPFNWRHEPTSITRWHGEWIVSDGTTQLYRFNANGVFVGTIGVPEHATDVVVAGSTLWVADSLTSHPADRLWRTEDGRNFTRFAVDDPKSSNNGAAVIRSQLVLAGSESGELYLAHMIDDPVVQRVYPLSRRASWPAEYSRTRRRAALSSYIASNDDLASYSSAVRDLLPSGSDLVALRNREDVRDGKRIVMVHGIHADRYSANGKLVASASFTKSVRWLISTDAKRVVGIDRSGVIVSAIWGVPLKGSIID